MSLFNILQHASQSLLTTGRGIQVTSNNVSNANTPGYSKQSLLISARGTERTAGGLLVGMGVRADQVLSAYDSFSQSQVFQRLGDQSFAESKTTSFESIEALFTEGGSAGIGTALYDFFDSFAELEVNPALPGARLRVLQAGQTLSSFFNRTALDLDTRQMYADNAVASRITGANNLSSQIASLNRTIKQFEAGGKSAHDLRSQRTALVEQLAEHGPVRTHDLADGTQRVMLGGHAIVEGGIARLLSAVKNPTTGFNEVHLAMGSTTINISSSMTNGTIGAALDERDTILGAMEAELDDLAFTIQQDVNAIHVTAFGLDGVSARNFFSTIAGPAGAAAAFSLDALVDGNPDAVAASSTAAGVPGDNTAAKALSALAGTNSMAAGTQTFMEYYSTFISALGHDSQLSMQDAMRTDLHLEAAKDVRDQASAVSFEEEAMDLVRFQDSYQAAARVMTVAKDMLDELLNLV
jgi:flagellar hook-associated protein 1 FlgK